MAIKGVNHKKAHPPLALMLLGDSEKDANMLYATRVFVPDPFVFIQVRGKKYILIHEMEHARVKKEACVDRVFSYGEASGLFGGGKSVPMDVAGVCAAFLKSRGVERIAVPRAFPLAFADDLRSKGFVVFARQDPYFPDRARKDEVEARQIRRSLLAAEYGMKAAFEALAKSTIDRTRKGVLRLGKEILTSERMRFLIHKAILEKSCHAVHTIVSCGKRGCDPHYRGEGPLYGNEPIIVDIFPRSEITGYYGDLTRTFVKGRASERVLTMYHTVDEAQRLAISMLKPGLEASRVHKAVCDFFSRRGFPREEKNGRLSGFIHGTGHGLGLDIHEHPAIGERPGRITEGNVVTVEPGLYYPDLGGVRLEDVVWITRGGAQRLSRFPHRLEID